MRTPQEVYGVQGLTDAERTAVRNSNLLVKRTCMLALRLVATGGSFTIENPVPRSMRDGQWSDYFHEKMSEHGSLLAHARSL